MINNIFKTGFDTILRLILEEKGEDLLTQLQNNGNEIGYAKN
jgi:hypothetical protein